jgi:NDP-sugar pyrophosphorylase family protein
MAITVLAPADFFELEGFEHKSLFRDSQVAFVWDVLRLLRGYLDQVIVPDIQGQVMEGAHLMGQRIFIGPGSVVEPGVVIKGPTYVGANTQVRHGAYIRGSVLVGDHCVVGHATEVKNAIFLDGAQAGHFAYVGDSILGNHVNLGAGTKLANVKLDRTTVAVRVAEQAYDTGLRKLGAVLGDRVQTGCNAVFNPGTLLGPGCVVYALCLLRGYYAANAIIKRPSEEGSTLQLDT